MANATLEAEIREEASTEMAQHLQRLEMMYMKRLHEQVRSRPFNILSLLIYRNPQSEASELKTDMKIDIMQRGMGSMAVDYGDHSLEAAIDQSLVSLGHSIAAVTRRASYRRWQTMTKTSRQGPT